MSDNLHKDHRERVRKEFLAHGFNEDTPPHKVLELLLFFSIPRKDTNEIAHELLNHFGSLANILDAPANELKKIKGVGDNTVALFKLIGPLTRMYYSENIQKRKKYNNLDEICEFVLKKYIGYNVEVFAITSFNHRGERLGFDIVNKGDVNSVGVSVREIVETVIKRNGSSVILSHNHPGGFAVPSKADLELTQKANIALANLGIKLIDHFLIADGECVSLYQSKDYNYIFK